MICEQLKLTDEQAKDLDDSTEEYYNLLETNSFQSAADRLSKFRSMFNKYMIGFRMKGEAESLRAQYGFLGRLPGFTS